MVVVRRGQQKLLNYFMYFRFKKIEKQLMAQVIVRFSDVKFVTSYDCKSCFQIKINGSIIADPSIQPYTRLVIISRQFDIEI